MKRTMRLLREHEKLPARQRWAAQRYWAKRPVEGRLRDRLYSDRLRRELRAGQQRQFVPVKPSAKPRRRPL